MKDMFSIGELARYQNISKQTLIFYDKNRAVSSGICGSG